MVLGILTKQIMTKPAIKIEYGKTVQEAAKKMVKHRVGSIIVIKKNKAVGIITETDLNKRIVAQAKDPRKVKVEEVMSSPMVFCKPNDDIALVVEKMKKHKIKRIPVIEKGKIVGIVTNTDIARASPELMDILNFRLKMRSYLPSIKESSTTGICDVCGEYSDDLKFEDGEWVCERCRERELE